MENVKIPNPRESEELIKANTQENQINPMNEEFNKAITQASPPPQDSKPEEGASHLSTGREEIQTRRTEDSSNLPSPTDMSMDTEPTHLSKNDPKNKENKKETNINEMKEKNQKPGDKELPGLWDMSKDNLGKKYEPKGRKPDNPSDTNHRQNTTSPANKTKKKYVNTTMETFHQTFGRKSWAPYLTLKSEKEIKALKLDFELTKTYATREMRFQNITPCEWTIRTTTREQSEANLKINKINNINVTVTKNEILNYTYGTVAIPSAHELIDDTEEQELLETWKRRDRNVVDMETYKINNRKKPGKTIQIVKIKYAGEYLPERIPLFGEMQQVREHTPKAMQCAQCHKYGHTKKKCRGDPTCAICAEKHQTDWNCKGNLKCSNCGGDHHAKSQNCIHYEYFTFIKLLQTRSAMTYREAKLEAKIKGLSDPNFRRPYNAVARDNEEANISTRTENPNQREKEQTNEINTTANITTENRFQALLELEEKEDSGSDESTIDFEDIETSPDSSPTLNKDSGKRTKNQKKRNTTRKKTENIEEILNEIESQSPSATPGLWPELTTPQTRAQAQTREVSSDEEGMQEHTIQASIHASQGSPMTEIHTSESNTQEGNDDLEDMDFYDPTQAPQEQRMKKPKPPKKPNIEPSKAGATSTMHEKQTISEELKETATKTHNPKCGCHQCFVKIMDEIENPNPAKLHEEMNKFTQTRDDPQTHLNPANQCKCSMHLKIKMKEPTWVNNIIKEIKTKKETKINKIEIKLNPQKRDPRMKIN